MANDTWATPQAVIETIEAWLGMDFTLDVCASYENAKASHYIDEETDALNPDIEWKDYHPGGQGVFYMNPPYSNPYPWAERAAKESQRGNIVVGLMIDDRSTRWYQDNVEGLASVALIPNKRIRFINPETGLEQGGNSKGSVIPIWTPWRTGRTEYVRISL